MWSGFRRSPLGLAGAVLLLLFAATAVAAPWIAPFTPEQTAPSVDILEAHSVAVPLPPGQWVSTRGIVDPDGNLVAVTALAADGHLVVFPVEPGRLELTLGAGRNVTLPTGTKAMDPVPAEPPFLLSWNRSAVVRWGMDFDPAGAPETLGFSAEWASGPVLHPPLHAAAWAGEREVALLVGRDPLGASFGESRSAAWWSRLPLADANLVGAPLVLLLDERGPNLTAAQRGNLLLLPTDQDVRAHEILLTRSGSRILDARIGPLAWRVNVTGLVPGSPLAFATTTADAFGKDRVFAATADGRVLAIDRASGQLIFEVKPFLRAPRDALPTALSGSPRGDLLITFATPEGPGALARLDPRSGAIAANHSAYVTLPSVPVARPQYVEALKQYVFSTAAGNVLLVDGDMRVHAAFSIPGRTATPVVYVGNIFSNVGAPQKGNYFAAVTADGKLFAQSTGNLRTPLPPGCTLFGVTLGASYPSGNCYLLGTDAYGHDILSWLIWGTRAELFVGLTAATAAVVIGTVVGLVAGYVGGLLDDLLMRITDINLTLPVLVIALLVVAMWGPSLTHVILIIAFLSWSVTARVIRSQALSLKERPFVNAARMSGASSARIVFRHLAPNVLPFAFLFLTFGVSGAIIVEALLAFLGFGDPNAVTWGMMLQFLYISGHTLTAPWWLVPPGLSITILSLSFYLVGRAFDDVVNPRLRSR